MYLNELMGYISDLACVYEGHMILIYSKRLIVFQSDVTKREMIKEQR